MRKAARNAGNDQLWKRLGDRLSWGARYLPWIITLNVSAHWIRHTTLTWVERNFSFATAHAYAGTSTKPTPATPP